MPELPEVETVRATLVQWLVNRTIEKVECFYARMMKPSIKTFKAHVEHSKIIALRRRGKYIIVDLDHGWSFLSHLRMEGKYDLIPKHDPLPKYAIAVFTLDHDTKLVYTDTRKFGTLELFKTNELTTISPLARLGIEPFDLRDPAQLQPLIQHKKKAIKSILLDQRVIAGVGNIYADEILFRSRIHPETPGHLLSIEDVQRLQKETKSVIEAAVKVGGTTIRTYHAPSGIDGLFQHQLLAYGQNGKPCPRCHIPLIKMQLHGRGTTFCRHCQHRPDRPWIVGVTGEIASGKSTLLHVAQRLGLSTISSDAIVKFLYEKKAIQQKLIKLLGKEAVKNQKVNSAFVLKKLSHHHRVLLQLESWLHPLVIQHIMKKINATKAAIVIVEVPLLFKTEFVNVCQEIIGIQIERSLQRKRLEARSPDSIDELLILNAHNPFHHHLHEVSTMLTNNDSQLAFESKCEKVLQSIIKQHSIRLT